MYNIHSNRRMFEMEMTSLPDADIQIAYRNTGRLGTIDVVTLAKQIAIIAQDLGESLPALPIEAGANIVFSTDPLTSETIISLTNDIVVNSVDTASLLLVPVTPEAPGIVGEILYDSPTSGSPTAGRFIGDNGTPGVTGIPYKILDFNPADLIAGAGITITTTDTTATISSSSIGAPVSSLSLINASIPGTNGILTVGTNGQLQYANPNTGGTPSSVVDSISMYPGLTTGAIAIGAMQYKTETYLIEFNASTTTGYSAMNAPTVPTGVTIVSPGITVTPPPLAGGPIMVTVALSTPFNIGYSTAITPAVVAGLTNPYQQPQLSLDLIDSNLAQVSFYVEYVVQPLSIPVLGITLNNPTLPTQVPTVNYSFAVQLTVTGL
jgi:hypothetical protein